MDDLKIFSHLGLVYFRSQQTSMKANEIDGDGFVFDGDRFQCLLKSGIFKSSSVVKPVKGSAPQMMLRSSAEVKVHNIKY